jgi:hypothetical protein
MSTKPVDSLSVKAVSMLKMCLYAREDRIRQYYKKNEWALEQQGLLDLARELGLSIKLREPLADGKWKPL